MTFEEKAAVVKARLTQLEEEYGVRLTGWDDGSVTIWEDAPAAQSQATYWVGKGEPK